MPQSPIEEEPNAIFFLYFIFLYVAYILVLPFLQWNLDWHRCYLFSHVSILEKTNLLRYFPLFIQ